MAKLTDAMPPPSDGFRDYSCSYTFNGGEWGIYIRAQSFDEAHRGVRAIGLTGKVDGELVAIIPAYPGAGLFVRAWCWIGNLFAKREP